MVGNIHQGGAQGNPPPPPPPRVFNKVATRYAPLVLPANLNDLPDNYVKNLPKFNGENDVTVVEHLVFFEEFVDVAGVEHEDVYMRLLVQTFEGEVRLWFRGLPPNSIDSYEALEDAFLRQWGEKKDHLYYLTEFGALRKKNNESVSDFIKIFNKTYNKIPADVKPSQPAAKVTFAGAFDPDFALLLRERRSRTLYGMQEDAIEIESNMLASGKLKIKAETGARENKRFKEQGGPSGSGKDIQDEKINEMAKLIKDLSNKLSRMEMERVKPEPNIINPNQFRRNFNTNPQIQQRPPRNDDQKIQAPFKTENMIDDEEET
jgi:hypothetical protein